jgi:hypothetical protein
MSGYLDSSLSVDRATTIATFCHRGKAQERIAESTNAMSPEVSLAAADRSSALSGAFGSGTSSVMVWKHAMRANFDYVTNGSYIEYTNRIDHD